MKFRIIRQKGGKSLVVLSFAITGTIGVANRMCVKQTNIPKEDNQKCSDLWKKDAEDLYNLVYCQRCLAEQYNQEFKAQTFGQRVNSSRYLTNSYRILLAPSYALKVPT